MSSNILSEIENYVFNLFESDSTGHDYFHMKRVAKMADFLAGEEGADKFIVVAAAWLHDVGDAKLFATPDRAKKDLHLFLQSIQLSEDKIEEIFKALMDVSFSKGHKEPDSLEGKIVQDADRLDAIGAIGIARTFAYGGANGQLLYSEESKETSVHHFYEKLLKLKDLMNTESAKVIAEERHRFMENYLQQFFFEWEIKN